MESFALIGNNLSADFVNTVVSTEHDGGTLRSARDVVDFLSVSGAIDPADAERVRSVMASGASAQRLLTTALELRNAVTAAFTAMEQRTRMADEALATINGILAADAGFEQLAYRDAGYRLERHAMRDDPAVILAPVARDTARLLATPGAPVRQCAGVGCVRHFFDDSRTKRRRWCEMAICGNRAKTAAFVQRHRGA